MSFQTLRIEASGVFTTVFLNRPDKLNAINGQIIAELSELVRSLSRESASTRPRALLLTGAGDKAFAAGADLSEMTAMTVAEAQSFSRAGHRLGLLMEEAPFPIVGAVNGYALGGGCELALACDFIYASESARFGTPEVGLGLIPGFGGTQRLARRVGLAWARELLYTAEALGAEEARAIGLANRVFAPAELLVKARETCQRIAGRAPLAVAETKRVVRFGYNADMAQAAELEAIAFGAMFASKDAQEGMRAFAEKRKPSYEGQ